MKLADALDDRASFRRFCGFYANEATPERTAFVRFGRLFLAHKLDRALVEAMIMQLKSKAAMVKAGTLVDATIIASAGDADDDALWMKHKGKRAVYDFKADVGVDADPALVEKVSVTSANINDGQAGPLALPDSPGEVLADSAYCGNQFRDAVRAKGGISRIVAASVWARTEEEAQAWLHQWIQPIHRVRGRIEKIFGTWKRCYGLQRMRWQGFAKAAVQVHLTAIAYNLKRTMNIFTTAA